MAQIKIMISVNEGQRALIQKVGSANINAYIRGLIAQDMQKRGEDWPRDRPVGREMNRES